MVGRQKKTLPLVGLVASLPTAAGFVTTCQGGRSSSAIDVSPQSSATEASRRAFLVASSSSSLVATAFVCPAEADVGRFKLKDLFKRNEQVDSSDSDSDDSDSDSVSSEDEMPQEKGKVYDSSSFVKQKFEDINGSSLDESSPAGAADVTVK